MKLSLIIPCFNEEDCVKLFFNEADSIFSTKDYKTEYIFVNDGSNDSTLLLLKELYDEHKDNINIISFSRNFGKEAAMYAGLQEADGDLICFIDADLQQPPLLVARMVELLQTHSEYDCVCAYSQDRADENKFIRFLKSSFYKFISKISEIEFTGGASDFRCFRKKVKNSILELSEYHRFTKGLFAWIGFNTHYVKYEIKRRSGGNSKWSTLSLFKYALEGIMAFSTKPLFWPMYIACSETVIAITYFIIRAIICDIQKQPLPTTAVLLTAMLMLSAISMFFMGIFGGYLAKIHIQVKSRPVYIIAEKYISSSKKKTSGI